LGRFLIYRRVTETTMVLARREAEEGAPHGTLVLAEEQTAGRGRRGRSFFSPAGRNLYFTMVLRLPIEVHRLLPVSVPLAVCAAARAEGVDARIKWPNDVWVGERKLSGMLIDAEITAQGALALPGIGINVNGDPTVLPELRNSATSLARELGRDVDREELLARLCGELERVLACPREAVIEEYREMSMILGRRVLVHPAEGQPWAGEATEIAEDGGLVVVRETGGVETVAAADVSVRPGEPLSPLSDASG
jgi:BirA family biotin operon repressor/biotin-[acetyl-CoA-carboxylase] ligase